MSLFDRCIEISSDLARTFAHHATDDYSVDQIAPLVEAMFNIATTANYVGNTKDVGEAGSKITIPNMVVGDLLVCINFDTDEKEVALEMLSRVALRNLRLKNAIFDFHEWLASPAGTIDPEDMETLFDGIDLLYSRCTQIPPAGASE